MIFSFSCLTLLNLKYVTVSHSFVTRYQGPIVSDNITQGRKFTVEF